MKTGFIFLLALVWSMQLSAQTIPAPTQTDEIIIDNGTSGKADPGDRIRYKVTIQNTGANPATGVQLNVVPDPRTTLVPGSFRSSPLALPDAYASTGNVGIIVPAASGLKVNDFDDNLAGLTVLAETKATDQLGGSVTIAADGSFNYTPPPGFTGTDTFTYTLEDGNEVSGVTGTDAGTVTITVSNLVYFIDNSSVAVTSDGRLTSPYKSLADFNSGSTNTGSVIFIENTGTAYTGGIVLADGERLFGEGHTGGSNLADVLLPLTLAPNSKPLPAINGTRPVITNSGGDGVTLAQNNTLRGFDVGACSDFGMENTGTNSVGNLVVSEVSINNTTGGGFDASQGSGASMNDVFTAISTTGGAAGINLVNTAGTFNAGSGALTNSSGANVIISGGTVNFTYSGNISQSTNVGIISISGSHSGTATFQTGTISATNGPGLQFATANGIYNFNGTTTLNGGDAGIDIVSNSVGTFTFSTGTSITRANGVSGAAFNLVSSNANVTYNGSMTLGTGTGNLVNIDNHDAGTINFNTGSLTKGSSTTQGISISNSNGGAINFNNPTIAITMTSGNAVSLTTNSGSAINFTPASGGNGMDLTTTSGIGFNATGSGTISVTGTGNTITSTTGTALNVANTTIGASGLTFLSISTNGAPNGIVLNTTGSSGGLTVTGTGSANSGGTIQNTTSHGISLSTTTNASFNNMNIQSTAGSGVRGLTAITNFTFTNGTINNSGTGAGNQESNIAFNDPSGSATDNKVSGTVTITGNTLTNALWHGVSILQFAGTLDDVNVSNNVLTSGTTTGGGGNSLGSGIQLVAGGVAGSVASVTRAELNNNTITNFPGGVLMALQGGTANGTGPVGTFGIPGSPTNDIEVKNNILNGGGTTESSPGVFVKPNQLILATINGRGQGNFNIQDNGTVADPISGAIGNMIDISAGGNVTVQATVRGNRIDAAGQTVSGTSGIAAGVGSFDVIGPPVITLGNSTLYATVENNVINNSAGSGIRLNVNNGTPTLNAIVKGNTVGTPISATYGIQVVEGPTGTKVTNLEISNNTSTGGSGGGNTFAGIGLRKQSNTLGEFNLVGLSPSPATTPQMEASMSTLNPNSSQGSFDSDGAPFARVVAIATAANANWTNIASVPQP